MAGRAYLKPPWWQRAIGNRLAPRFGASIVSTLSVRGRTSGQWRTVPVSVLDHDGERYLISPYGDSDWSRNLRAAGGGRLRQRGNTEEFTAVEVPPDQRSPLHEEYQRRFGKAPGVRSSFARLPDPADHPTFRIVSTETTPSVD